LVMELMDVGSLFNYAASLSFRYTEKSVRCVCWHADMLA